MARKEVNLNIGCSIYQQLEVHAQTFTKRRIYPLNPHSQKLTSNICSLLTIYWNFLDYSLMEYIAVSFGNEEVRQSMRRYIHDLTKFRKSVTVSEIRKLWPNEMNFPDL